MNDPVIQTHSLTKRYGRIFAVDALSMNVPRGSIFGLLGPNGSGKTTVMSMLLGLVQPTAGDYRLFGPGTGHTEALHRVGAIVESPAFYPYLSGRQNLNTSRVLQAGGTPGSWTSCWTGWGCCRGPATSTGPTPWA